AATAPGCDDPSSARAGAPRVGAWFQRAVERSAARLVARLVERVNFCMRLACALVGPLADHNAFVGDHARANHRIRRRPTEPALGEQERPPHPVTVLSPG